MDDTEPEQVNRIHLPPVAIILKEGAAAAAEEKKLISTRTEEAVAYWMAQARRVAQLVEHGLAGKGKGNTLEANVKKIGISYRTAFIILRLDDEREMIEARIAADRERLGARYKWPTRAKMLEWASDAKPKTKAVPRKVLEAEIESLRERNADLEARLAEQPPTPEPAPAPVVQQVAPEPIEPEPELTLAALRALFRRRKEAAKQARFDAISACMATLYEAVANKSVSVDRINIAKDSVIGARGRYNEWPAILAREAAFFEVLGLDHPPADLTALNAAYRRACVALHRRHGSDTHPEYRDTIIEMNDAIAWLREVYNVALPEREFADFERAPEYA